jgi:hypothetical protein
MAATEPSQLGDVAMPASEPSQLGDVGWVELLSQQIAGHSDFRLSWTESNGTKRVLQLTHKDQDGRVVIYTTRKPDGAYVENASARILALAQQWRLTDLAGQLQQERPKCGLHVYHQHACISECSTSAS